MSWDNTYSHNVLYGLDVLGAVVFWNQRDITISSLCRLAQLAYPEGEMDAMTIYWHSVLASLKLYGWQVAVLRWLATKLNEIQANHCELARLADIARAKRVLALLEVPK